MRMMPGLRLLRMLFLGVPAAAVLFGIVLLVAGPLQAPRDDAAAQVFRDDPSCARDLARAPGADGACTVVDATIVTVYIPSTGIAGRRSASSLPAALLRFADGTERNTDLAYRDGMAFVRAIYPGTAARVQLFRGAVVRLAAGGYAAEAATAPDVMAASDAVLPWVGAVVILAGIAAIRVLRRAADAREGANA